MPHTHTISCMEKVGGTLMCLQTGQRIVARDVSGPKKRVRLGPSVYELSRADLKEWEGWNYSQAPLGQKVGKRIFEEHFGEWFRTPWSGSSTPLNEREVEKLIRTALNITSLEPSEIRFALSQEKKANDMRHYKALIEASRRLGLPVAYKRDLTTHDKMTLSRRDPNLPFGWFLRESGTNIFLPEHPYTRDFRQAIDQTEEAFGKGHWFGWDGRSLSEMTPAQLADWFDMERNRILR